MVRWIVALGALSGCEDVGSGDVLTSGMWADVTFVADGTGTSQAATALRVGGVLSNTYVELEGDDALTATLLDETLPMVEEQLGEIHRYVASFDTAPVGETLVVAFVRTVDDGAPSSVAELPPAFELEAPAVTTFARNTDDLVLTWSPASSETMRVEISGDCVFPYVEDLADAGTFILPAGTLDPLDDAAPASCSLDIVVSRRLPGTIDPAFGQGGTSFGIQVRQTEVGSTP